MTERFDITETDYEYDQEHHAYVAQFNGAMSIPDMQEYSLVYSENTPAYALAERLGGMNKAYQLFDRYGKVSGLLRPLIVMAIKSPPLTICKVWITCGSIRINIRISCTTLVNLSLICITRLICLM